MVSFDEFKKIELKIAKIILCERIEGSEKLLKLIVDCGDKDDTGNVKNRQILAGVGKVYDPERLVGREIVIVANLEHRMMMGLESQGMLLAASRPEGPMLLCPEHDVAPGAEIR